MNNTEITLPAHILALTQDEIDAITNSTDAMNLIIACGIDPEDSSLVVITGLGDVRILKPNGSLIPSYAKPRDAGKCLELSFVGHSGFFIIDSNLVIVQSESFIEGQSLIIGNSYDDENSTQRIEKDSS